jgi:hypothetical protein
VNTNPSVGLHVITPSLPFSVLHCGFSCGMSPQSQRVPFGLNQHFGRAPTPDVQEYGAAASSLSRE